ncbi:assimilatory nitrate reductase catalytic subunit [Fictibacillus solisalsi]|uniref:Assimilatory nitrate reductase catalytic subunit n=1 Tax=Fictibacillus solisalsi TaxID=459525 RepID=A0A1G9WMB2_9BACL|nr:nitrate reductase [Fictibacillus solisalsi]SDM85742.1 assimilatory nitrate reductase catalytic subunit [Fictibacillus solisalsi]
MTSSFLEHFRHQQQDAEKETVMDTQCPFCSVQCTMQLLEQRTGDRKKYKVLPLKDTVSEGRLCIKGRNAHQHTLHKERILHPMKKVNGQFVEITWEEALFFIKEQFSTLQEHDGPDSVGVYGGGSLTNEEAYLLGKFARVGLKTKHIDYNGRYCMSAAASAMNEAFGLDRGLTNEMEEVPLAECIILAGTNIAECQPTLLPYFRKAKDNGAFIIAIDPRETLTTKLADLHLKVKPGMDAALVNGMLKVILDRNLHDEQFIKERTEGFDEVLKQISGVDLDAIADLTGLPREMIEYTAVTFASVSRAMVFTARGVEQQTHGFDTVRNFINLVLATGNIGKPGAGYGAVTGQGNGQGGREHGQKADQLPGYRSIENPEHRNYIANLWGIPEKELPGKGISAYEMMEKIADGEIKALFIMGSNPLISTPNATLAAQALKRLKCLVVVDMFVSETGRLADLLLPSSSYLEDEGTLTNLEGRVTLRRAARSCPGEVRHDWQILCDVARVLGKEAYFSYTKAEDIFNELRVASKGGKADYFGITYSRLKDERIYWPCPTEGHKGEGRLFSETFARPNGKAKMLPVINHVPKERTSESYPLHLTTGRVMSHYLSGSQTRRSPALSARQIESFVKIHPKTANAFGIKDGTMVYVDSSRGRMKARGAYDDSIREDTLFIPFHWGGEQNVNNVTYQGLDPVCKMPGFKVCAVRVSPVIDLTRN